MDNKFVYGSYFSIEEAQKAAEELVDKGVPSDAISFIGDNPDASGQNQSQNSVSPDDVGGTGMGGETNFWTSAIGLFGQNASGNRPAEETDPDKETYLNSLENQGVLVMVEKKYQNKIEE